eukprot:5914205-Pyramimonas_sp.AAC.1
MYGPAWRPRPRDALASARHNGAGRLGAPSPPKGGTQRNATLCIAHQSSLALPRVLPRMPADH